MNQFRPPDPGQKSDAAQSDEGWNKYAMDMAALAQLEDLANNRRDQISLAEGRNVRPGNLHRENQWLAAGRSQGNFYPNPTHGQKQPSFLPSRPQETRVQAGPASQKKDKQKEPLPPARRAVQQAAAAQYAASEQGQMMSKRAQKKARQALAAASSQSSNEPPHSSPNKGKPQSGPSIGKLHSISNRASYVDPKKLGTNEDIPPGVPIGYVLQWPGLSEGQRQSIIGEHAYIDTVGGEQKSSNQAPSKVQSKGLAQSVHAPLSDHHLPGHSIVPSAVSPAKKKKVGSSSVHKSSASISPQKVNKENMSSLAGSKWAADVEAPVEAPESGSLTAMNTSVASSIGDHSITVQEEHSKAKPKDQKDQIEQDSSSKVDATPLDLDHEKLVKAFNKMDIAGDNSDDTISNATSNQQASQNLAAEDVVKRIESPAIGVQAPTNSEAVPDQDKASRDAVAAALESLKVGLAAQCGLFKSSNIAQDTDATNLHDAKKSESSERLQNVEHLGDLAREMLNSKLKPVSSPKTSAWASLQIDAPRSKPVISPSQHDPSPTNNEAHLAQEAKKLAADDFENILTTGEASTEWEMDAEKSLIDIAEAQKYLSLLDSAHQPLTPSTTIEKTQSKVSDPADSAEQQSGESIERAASDTPAVAEDLQDDQHDVTPQLEEIQEQSPALAPAIEEKIVAPTSDRQNITVREILLLNFVSGTTIKEVFRYIWGGPIDSVTLNSEHTMAIVVFLHIDDAQKYINAASMGIPYKGHDNQLIKVEPSTTSSAADVSAKALSQKKRTRCVKLSGIEDGDYSSTGGLRRLAAQDSRIVEHVSMLMTDEGVYIGTVRFASIKFAIQFWNTISAMQDEEHEIEDFNSCQMAFIPDPCALATGYHET